MIVDTSYLWLLAEAAAWPLASEAGFTAVLTSFARNPIGVFDARTKMVADSMEERVRPMSRGLSLDALRQLGGRAWFGDSSVEGAQPLTDYLARIAATHLEHRGNMVVLASQDDPSEVAARWRWISLALPPDSIVAALSASQTQPPVDAVELAPPLLAQRLNLAPFAETHLHVGAAVSFPMLWSSLARVIGQNGVRAWELKKSGGVPFGNECTFAQRMFEAFIGRVLIAAFLRSRRCGYDFSFGEFLRRTLQPIANAMNWPAGASDAALRLTAVAHSLSTAGSSAPWPELRLLYRRLVDLPRPTESSTADSPFDLDPLRTSYPARTSPEVQMQCEALQYLGCGDARSPGRNDRSFAALFWQYSRIRNIIYRLIVEQPGTAGLDWFGQHYFRISPMRGGLENTLYRNAMDVQSGGLQLGSIEVRTSPYRDWHAAGRHLRTIARQVKAFGAAARGAGQTPPEVGLVLHFIKTSHRGQRAQPALNADPRSHIYGCRYGEWFHARQREVNALERVLYHAPESLALLRGIDVANAELAIPTWVLLPLLRRVVTASRDAAATLHASQPQWRAGAIRTTVHAGEDYRTIIEGLRRIHELLEFGALSPGSRIGHGLALADDADRWRRRIGGIITQPAEERLDDLLWMTSCHLAPGFGDGSGRGRALEAEALKLARRLYDDDDVRIEDLLLARERRHDPDILAAIEYPRSRLPAQEALQSFPRWRRLLMRYLCDTGVFLRGQQAIEVPITADDVAFITVAQGWLRRELAAIEITVESNPSSNLLIGDMVALEYHPALRLQPLDPNAEGARVLLSINTDNPITFATRLADEFAYVYFALLRNRATTSSQALAWLEQRRSDGWLSRFTLPASTDSSILDSIAYGRRGQPRDIGDSP